MHVSIIVVSFNTREMTLACLRSVFTETSGIDFEVIVIDNASSDDSADAIEAEFGSQITLLKSKDNVGFAAANNIASQQASGKFLLLLNPDTLVLDRAINVLVAFAESHPNNKIYGGRTVFGDKSLNIASCWAHMTPWSLFCRAAGLTAAFPRSNWFDPEAMGDWKRDSVREVDIVVGCFLLIEREFWNRLGGFNLKYWMYGEEVDLCIRGGQQGARPIVTPQATIVHYVGASTNASPRKTPLVAKAKATLIHDHWNGFSKKWAFLMMWCWAAGRRIASEVLYRLRGSKAAATRETWKVVWDERRNWLAGYQPQSQDLS